MNLNSIVQSIKDAGVDPGRLKTALLALEEYLNKLSMNKLDTFCLAIRNYEGSPGDRNYRNNNPGNARYYYGGYLPIYGHVGMDKDGFAVFKDYDTGYLYLKNLVKHKIEVHPDWTISDFFHVYAPTADSNDPDAYAFFVAKRLGVDVTYKISNILT